MRDIDRKMDHFGSLQLMGHAPDRDFRFTFENLNESLIRAGMLAQFLVFLESHWCPNVFTTLGCKFL